ncbi:uncharacterized protein CTRU02_212268 [Colletotrichum truncatum]|uniref:Uncharacterized protein n=1 Tax=Colletotrichum truncatum TaxID=5467 RepID=A0ACC3YN29_COLTU|nr:uncharacterized protein CTRU02_08855 [Colletotrichum truncatum]KAF6789608.1 hypothetical protein CTRU02_08855 [Colletotrichum truncatum]
MNKKYYSLLLLFCNATTAVLGHILEDFQSPSADYRPKFRYWLPDAEVDIESVVKDVGEIAAVGSGGLEFLPYYQFRSPSANWSEYGYGSAASSAVLRATMKAADEHGILLDFAIGANQGQGVPADPESVGLALELAYSNVTIEPGRSFNGTLPLSTQPGDPALLYFMHPLEEFGRQNLSAVLATEIIDDALSVAGVVTIGRVIDLSNEVDLQTRSLSWTPPDEQNPWRLIAWYERYTNQRSIDAAPDAVDFIQNGSWVIDHFSAAGAEKLTKFFDDYLIPEDQDKALLSRVGKYAWEDSMEMQSALWWTHGFAEKFSNDHGYDIRQCLPFLIRRDTFWAASTLPYGESFVSKNVTYAERCNDDYRITLQSGYEEYIRANAEWARSKGLEYSNQPAYNLPLNMLDSIRLVDGPEGESLGFNDNPDLYRHLAGPAHMAGNPVVSSECGAIQGAGYTQTIQDLLWHVRRGMATGITMNVFHGYSYSGTFFNTTWPGYTVFAYTFTDMWGPRQPSWMHLNDTIAYISRNQFISQTGTPKVDIAFYQYAAPFRKAVYESNNLERLGFTYDYLGPRSISEDAAVVKGGLLALDGPAYKALVFANQTKMTLDVAKKVQVFAKAGLPIFIIGPTDFHSAGMNAEESALVSNIMNNVLAVEGSVVVLSSAEELPAALATRQINPRTALTHQNAGSRWYSFWRSSSEAEIVFLYNDGTVTETFEAEFENVAGMVPFILDAWTGTTSPLLQYTNANDKIVAPITLAPNQTTIIAFAKYGALQSSRGIFPRPLCTVVSAISGHVTGLVYSERVGNGSKILAYLSQGQSTVTLSNGKVRDFEASPPDALPLESWDITVNDWQSDADRYSMKTVITQHSFKNSSLIPWKDLDPINLRDTSGTADYRTTFSTPLTVADQKLGARLHLGPIVDSPRLWVNGARLSIDLTSADDIVVDITNHLAPSMRNEIRIEVASTLYNRVRAEQDSIWTFGSAASVAGASYYDANPSKPHGLVGPAFVEWVEVVGIA